MFNLQGISANNGWNISMVGVSIVFSGLTVLAILISQLHKLLVIWDQRDKHYQKIKELLFKLIKFKRTKKADIKVDSHLSHQVHETAKPITLLVGMLGEPFALPKLLELTTKCGLLHSHSKINALLKEKLIIPDGKGYYYLKKTILEDNINNSSK